MNHTIALIIKNRKEPKEPQRTEKNRKNKKKPEKDRKEEKRTEKRKEQKKEKDRKEACTFTAHQSVDKTEDWHFMPSRGLYSSLQGASAELQIQLNYNVQIQLNYNVQIQQKYTATNTTESQYRINATVC